MTTPELLALSLGLSVVVAALAYVGVRLFERGVADPVLRERAWAVALYLPFLPVVLTVVLLIGPRPVVEAPAVTDTTMTVEMVAALPARAPGIDTEQVAWALLGLAGLLGLARGAGLARRTLRLRRLVREACPASHEMVEVVGTCARLAGVTPPEVRLCPAAGEALVAGVAGPILILPASLAGDPNPAVLRAVCAHELAHLKRGDHRALWIEEVLLTALAINPILRAIRDRRAAAREEACDLQVLAHADGDARRLYARSLLDALRASTGGDVPALTFTSNRRIFVMHRLKAILSPAPVAGSRSRLALLGLGVALAAVAGTGSVALAAKREPVVVSVVMPVPAVATAPARVSAPVAIPIAAAAPAPVAAVPVVEAVPEPAPEPRAVPQAQVITNPNWSQMPTPLRFPAAALEQDLTSGSAELSCSVESDGRVTACTVLTEEPLGAGFGDAALEAAARARLSPQSVEGVAAGGLRFIVRFTRSTD
ncbi:TonB family protein [Brevundimonas staleyi]|uniref:TonB family protein n=1 Tax=Brevundimonas staleyi TaxID=74326 RepID=A0ABW0FRE6_9CAUL